MECPYFKNKCLIIPVTYGICPSVCLTVRLCANLGICSMFKGSDDYSLKVDFLPSEIFITQQVQLLIVKSSSKIIL